MHPPITGAEVIRSSQIRAGAELTISRISSSSVTLRLPSDVVAIEPKAETTLGEGDG